MSAPIEKLLEELQIRHELNVPLGAHTWFGVGGAARALAHPSSVQQLSTLAARCHEAGVPVYVLGAGANLLVSDRGVDGVVIKLDDKAFKQVKREKNVVTAGAGVDVPKLILDTARDGLGGLECLAGFPATVGGAVKMNAGGIYGDIGKSVLRVHVMDASGHVYYRDRDDLVFSYRKSNIVARFILEAEFSLTPDDPDELSKRVKEIFFYKKNTQPLAAHTAGSTFKNPRGRSGGGSAPVSVSDHTTSDPAVGASGGAVRAGHGDRGPDESLAETDPVVADAAPADSGADDGTDTTSPYQQMAAGQLIDMAGLKGKRVGGAEVSPHHANFLIAHAGCTATDLLQLIELIEQTVLERFGVKLEREVVVWP